jgi:hypothetical protein
MVAILSQQSSKPSSYHTNSIAVVPYCIYRLFKIYKETRTIKLGREGERAVGQFLERLRADGCVVFHDIIGDNFNLDHVIVSKKGIFTIETKTYSKPEKGEAKILFDGEKLAVHGSGTYDQPVIQVKAASTWLKNTIKATTGKTFAIKPVILFPGWYVESSEQGKRSGTWVLNPKSLPSFYKQSTRYDISSRCTDGCLSSMPIRFYWYARLGSNQRPTA